MDIPNDATLLRIFIGESDRWKHQALYEAIVLRARELQIAGATVLRGPMSFGATSRIHTREDFGSVHGPADRDRDREERRKNSSFST